MGGARGVEIAVALVRQKVIAALLGPSGYGVLGWLRNVYDLLITFPLLGLDGSSVRFISSHNRDGDREAIQRAVSTTLWVALINSPLVVAIYWVFSRHHLTHAMAGLQNGEQYLTLLRVGLLSVPLASGAAAFGAFLIGFKQVRRASVLIVISSTLTLLVGVPMICLWGLWGAVVSIVILQAINLVIYGWSFAKVFPIRLVRFSFSTLRRMSGVAAVNWIGGGAALLALLLARSKLSVDYSNDVMGLFNSVYVLCSSYLGPLAHSLIFYTYPRMSELRSREEIAHEINQTLRLVVLLSTPAMVLMGTAVKPLLFALFSSRFVAAAPLLPLQMMGEWFRLPMRTMGMALLGQERLKPYLFFDLLFHGLFVAVTWLGADYFAIVYQGQAMSLAPCAGYALGALAGMTGYYFVTRRVFGYRVGADNRRLILASLLALTVSLFWSPEGSAAYGAAAAKVALLGFWAAYVVRPEEWAKAKEMIQRRWGNSLT